MSRVAKLNTGKTVLRWREEEDENLLLMHIEMEGIWRHEPETMDEWRTVAIDLAQRLYDLSAQRRPEAPVGIDEVWERLMRRVRVSHDLYEVVP